MAPTWDWECTFGQVCQAGAATLGGGATLSQTFPGYESTAGYAGFFVKPGASVTWHVIGSKAGPAAVSLRYYNLASPPLTPTPSTLDLDVNGRFRQVIDAAPTTAAEPWATFTTTVPLVLGTNSIKVVSTTPEQLRPGHRHPGRRSRRFATSRSRRRPDLSEDGSGGSTPTPTTTHRPAGLDSPVTPAKPGIQPLNTDGLLDTAGWRLLDDTQSALWTTNGWIEPRPAHGDLEDGYLFVYGDDYAGALHTLARTHRSGAPPSPERLRCVVLRLHALFEQRRSRTRSIPSSSANQVPLNTLSLDTDWKAPNDWNGWEWNPSLFPSPSSFLHWARSHGIDVTLNIHSSIDDNDPKLPEAERIAGHALASSSCTNGNCKVWDWSSIPQAESNFALQQSFQRQGVSFWWLDWCCDDSVVSSPGVTPDAWIGHLYAQDMVNLGERGFVLARIGGSNGDPQEVYPAGPWSDHTSAIAFTGDAWGTWNTLATEAALVPDEATIGEPYVSSDIGSYLGPPPTQSGADPPDLYDRWVQLGTFEPILRLHSNDENRLPWQYPQPVQGITESFLRLREALLPYTYTLAAEANQTGLPMARPLYLDYPDQPSAYQNPTEYLYGPDMLVAPVTTPGDVASTTVWFPPGTVGRLLHRCHVHGSVLGHPGGAARPDAGLRPPGWDRSRAAVHRGIRATARAHRPRLPGIVRVLRPLRRRRNGARLHQGPAHRDPHHHVVECARGQTAVGPGHDRCSSGQLPRRARLCVHHCRDGRCHPTESGHPRWSEPARSERIRPALDLPCLHGDTHRGHRVAAGGAARARGGGGCNRSHPRRADRVVVRFLVRGTPII